LTGGKDVTSMEYQKESQIIEWNPSTHAVFQAMWLEDVVVAQVSALFFKAMAWAFMEPESKGNINHFVHLTWFAVADGYLETGRVLHVEGS